MNWTVILIPESKWSPHLDSSFPHCPPCGPWPREVMEPRGRWIPCPRYLQACGVMIHQLAGVRWGGAPSLAFPSSINHLSPTCVFLGRQRGFPFSCTSSHPGFGGFGGPPMLPFLTKSGVHGCKHWLILCRKNMRVGCSEPQQKVLAKARIPGTAFWLEASCPMILDRPARQLGGGERWDSQRK